MTLTHKPTTVGKLGTNELTMLREMLMQQRDFRLDQLDRLRHAAVRTRPRTPADLEVDRSLREGAQAALHDVELALSRMRAGTFGRCLHCESTLPLERLEILPHAALGMSCQRARDTVA
jgi:DnaK suppressor protein